MTHSLGSILTGSCLSGSCFKINKYVPFSYGPWAFQSVVFALVFRYSEFMREPFKSMFSVPWSSVVFLDIFSVDFQSQIFWGLVFPVQGLGVGVELKSLAPEGKDLFFCDPSQLWITVAGVWVFPWWDCVSTSLPHLSDVLLPFVAEFLFIQFSGPFLMELFHM